MTVKSRLLLTNDTMVAVTLRGGFTPSGLRKGFIRRHGATITGYIDTVGAFVPQGQNRARAYSPRPYVLDHEQEAA